MSPRCGRRRRSFAWPTWTATASNRLLGAAILPPEDPAAARDEVYRLAKKGGLRQANLQIAGATPGIHDEAWEPAFEETGLIMSFHVVVFGVGGSLVGVPAHVQDKPAGVFNTTKLFMGQFLDPFVDLFAWGILEGIPSSGCRSRATAWPCRS